MRYLLATILATLLLFSFAFADEGVIKVKSHHDVKTTVNRLVKALEAKGMKIFVRVDFSKGAKSAGQDLRPTELVVFGNPKIGTKLMQCNQEAGIDLPMKALIWKDKKGQVWVSYNDPEYIADRHDVEDCGKAVVGKMKAALKNFVTAATAP